MGRTCLPGHRYLTAEPGSRCRTQLRRGTQERKDARELGRRRALEPQPLAGDRMDKPEKPGMQQDAVETDRQRWSLAAIDPVSSLTSILAARVPAVSTRRQWVTARLPPVRSTAFRSRSCGCRPIGASTVPDAVRGTPQTMPS